MYNKFDELVDKFNNDLYNFKRNKAICQEMVDNAKSLNDDFTLGRAYSYIAQNYFSAESTDLSKKYCLKSLKLLSTGIPCVENVYCYNLLGIIYSYKGDIVTSVEYYIKAIDYAEEYNITFNLAMLYNNVGNVFCDIYDYKTAIKYLKKALKVFSAYKQNGSRAFVYASSNLCRCYNALNIIEELEKTVVLLENNKDVTLEPKEVERYLNISKLKLYMNRRDKENFHSLFLKLMVEFRENVNIDLTLDMLNDCLFWIKFGFIDEAKEFLGFCSNFIFDYNIKNLERIYYYAMIKVCEAEKNEKLKQEMIFKYYEIGEYIREDLQNINAENVKNKIALFELKKSMHKTEVAAMTDSLTQIYNRTSFNNLILKRFDVACKLNQQVGVIFIDIDWFKEFNDTFGHAQGDKCLQFVANEMKKNSKVLKDSMCIRYGGDEFLIITFNNSLNEVCELIKKIKDRITDRKMPNPLAKYKIVTISSGVCVEQVNNSSDIYSLIIKADRALYRSKEVKNTIEIAKPGS